MRNFVKLLPGRSGSVSILVAVVLPLTAGMSGLAVEYGYGLLTSTQNQRVADLAAYSGALAYNTANSTTTMNSAINNVASLNGYPSSTVASSVVNSPSGSGNQAVQVQVTTTVARPLSGLIGGASTMPVSAWSYAELKPTGSACIIALGSAGTGVTLSGGTSVTASSCAVASDAAVGGQAAVSVPCGTSISTVKVNYAPGSSVSECTSPASITAPSGKSLSMSATNTTDPLAGNSGVTAARARLGTVSSLGSPAAPTPVTVPTSSANVNLGYSNTNPQSFGGGITATYSGNTWTVNCSASCTINQISVQGGQNLMFTGPSTATFNFDSTISTAATASFGAGTYNFAGNISTSGTTSFGTGTYNINGQLSLTGSNSFGAGTYNIVGGITAGGGSTTTFGSGTFNIGPNASCNGGTYSICNSSTSLTFNGPSSLSLSAGIYNAGGSTLSLGAGSTANSYQIGKSSDGKSFNAGGGAKTTLGDATNAGNLFQVNGVMDVSSGGGSCLTLPAAAQHDINGAFISAGGTVLGAGVYTVNGYVALGASGGGSVSCNGASVGMTGNGVTLTISGLNAPTSGTCANTLFCVSAGFSGVSIIAPASGTTAALAVIGPAAGGSVTAGVSLGAGASNMTMSGALYVPNGAITMSGGSGVSNSVGNCFELIGNQVTLSGGATAASTCTGLSSTQSISTVSLVR